MQKISENQIMKITLVVLALFNFNLFFLPVQIPYTLLNVDFIKTNELTVFKSKISTVNKYIPKGSKVSFITNESSENVLIKPRSTKDFFMTQYFIIPSILENNQENEYMIGVFDSKSPKKIYLSHKYRVFKVIDNGIILFKRLNDA